MYQHTPASLRGSGTRQRFQPPNPTPAYENPTMNESTKLSSMYPLGHGTLLSVKQLVHMDMLKAQQPMGHHANPWAINCTTSGGLPITKQELCLSSCVILLPKRAGWMEMKYYRLRSQPLARVLRG